MLILLITVVIVGVSAYVWCTRGFFSALLHLMCVFAAGAIAFGVWEPLSYFILDKAPERGFGSWLADMPFALGLVLPFAISLAILRGVVDKMLPANAQCDTAVDYVGGGICGLFAGIITAGIVVIGLNFLRVKPTWGGYEPVIFSQSVRGSLEKTPSKLIPWVDRITAGLYSNLSFTTLRSGEPLGRYYPDLVAAGAANRQTYEGKGRTGMKQGTADLVGWYTVGSFDKPQKMDDLTKDIRQQTPQKAILLSGDEIERGALAGYILNFGTKAREGTGAVVIGNGQLRLVCESTLEEDEYLTVHPIAVVSRVNDPAEIRYARFRFDSDGFFVSSVGGESQAVLGFEFPVPEGYRPIALYARNLRIPVDEETLAAANAKPLANFKDPLERDAMILAGQMEGMKDVGPIIDPVTGEQVVRPDTTIMDAFRQDPVRVSSALGFTIQKGTEQGITTVKKERGGYMIQNGEMRTNKTMGFGQVDRNLQIAEFQVNDDTVMVQVDLTPNFRGPEITQLLESAPKDGHLLLRDTAGTTYEAVGFVYEEPNLKHIRYTRGTPLKSMNDGGFKPVTRNTPDREIRLLFIVSRGVTVKELRIGDVLIQDNINLKADTGR